MKTFAKLAVLFVALIHIYILILEMFLWTKPMGLAAFDMTPQVAADSAVLAANQGLYNGFLAAGLLWGLLKNKRDFVIFFLCCVIVAGIYGAATAKPTILFIQALPAAIALALTLLSKPKQV